MIHGALRHGRRRAANAPSTRFSFICARPTAWPTRAFATSPPQGAALSNTANINNVHIPKARGVEHAAVPNKASRDFRQRLELCLPPHLREDANGGTQDASPFVPDAVAVARLALDDFSKGKGLLTFLALVQGRWRAAVWIVKLLVEHFHKPPVRSDRLSHTIQKWNKTGTLDDLTEHPVYLVRDAGEPLIPHIRTSSSASLHELTDDKPDSLSRDEVLRHEVLGSVWRDIGRLIINCSSRQDIADGEVKPDVLEMIALLHHYELMPASIYTYVPAESEGVIQQPPTLHLLSSRIFTALSDATWRARELTAVEEAKRKGGELMGLEAKGSSYRVRVSGIKPEIWLELVLWACLHGGWISDGVDLLRTLYLLKRDIVRARWNPMSWRDSLDAVMPFGQEHLLDWDNIRYIFDTRSNATMDGVDVAGLRVDRTVSSEVVNAYIDALLSTISVGVGSRGLDLGVVMHDIQTLKAFLERAKLNLGGGSWDAMILRLVESGGLDINRDPSIVPHLVQLSPAIGEELRSRRSQAIPKYVLDGSAAVLGLLHRALLTEIKNQNLKGALKSFKLLQKKVDKDRHQSLSDFFAHNHLAATETDESAKGLFTSNFFGIDYPTFSTQIPPTTLAAFLELVTVNKKFGLGNWMLGIVNLDLDGPLIPASMFSDPHISAAVVHFATATNNAALLSKVTKLGAVQPEEGSSSAPALPKELLQAFLHAQIDLKRWDVAEKILAYMRDTEDFDWSIGNAASLAKAMIIESENVSTPDQVNDDFSRAEQLFHSLLAGEYGMVRDLSAKHSSMNTLCVMISTISPLMAASVRKDCALPKHFNFTLRARAFNSVLEGVVATLGSAAGQAFVDKFAITRRNGQHRPDKDARTRDLANDELESQLEDEDERDMDINNIPERTIIAPTPRMPHFLRDAVKTDSLARTKLNIIHAGEETNYTQTVAMYGGFKAISPTTVRIIVRQALAERSQTVQAREPPSLDIYAWALVTLRRAGLDQSAARDELDSVENGLTDDEMGSVERRAEGMWARFLKREKKGRNEL